MLIYLKQKQGKKQGQIWGPFKFYSDQFGGIKINKISIFIGAAEIEKSLKHHQWPGYTEK